MTRSERELRIFPTLSGWKLVKGSNYGAKDPRASWVFWGTEIWWWSVVVVGTPWSRNFPDEPPISKWFFDAMEEISQQTLHHTAHHLTPHHHWSLHCTTLHPLDCDVCYEMILYSRNSTSTNGTKITALCYSWIVLTLEALQKKQKENFNVIQSLH